MFDSTSGEPKYSTVPEPLTSGLRAASLTTKSPEPGMGDSGRHNGESLSSANRRLGPRTPRFQVTRSGRTGHGPPVSLSRHCHPGVIGDEVTERGLKQSRGRQVNGVEAAKLIGLHHAGCVEHRIGQPH